MHGHSNAHGRDHRGERRSLVKSRGSTLRRGFIRRVLQSEPGRWWSGTTKVTFYTAQAAIKPGPRLIRRQEPGVSAADERLFRRRVDRYGPGKPPLP
jgi:hypothetical protein